MGNHPRGSADRGTGRSFMKKGRYLPVTAFLNKILAVSYSHMGRPHTTIGAECFHFRVRNGIGWFPLAIAARKTVRRPAYIQANAQNKLTIWDF